MVGNGFERQAPEEELLQIEIREHADARPDQCWWRCRSGRLLFSWAGAGALSRPARCAALIGRLGARSRRRVPTPDRAASCLPAATDPCGGRPDAGKVAPEGSSPLLKPAVVVIEPLAVRLAVLRPRRPSVSMWCISRDAHLARRDAQAEDGVEEAALHRADNTGPAPLRSASRA